MVGFLIKQFDTEYYHLYILIASIFKKELPANFKKILDKLFKPDKYQA